MVQSRICASTAVFATASGCPAQNPLGYFRLAVGLHDRRGYTESNLFNLAKITVHPNNSATGFHKDLALLTLDRPVPRTVRAISISRIVLPGSSQVTTLSKRSNSFMIIGWVYVQNASTSGRLFARKLQDATFALLSQKECELMIGSRQPMFITKLCIDSLTKRSAS
ncbi:hypothetical protein BV898_10785 [Hypsibius exemplaris]|uniref:Peptidase S1 domain-containing protein n=1 Tax=Hypsibius exemplaris TaxID=2072580 RepID=A0A1W0WIL6_HYPEX|nr:hypothetical protein BV898_10785 [Hypsibius exemplaris]